MSGVNGRGSTTYRVLIASTKEPGKLTSASGDYVQRASAFKRARAIAAATGQVVKVWSYSGPDASEVLDVPELPHDVDRAVARELAGPDARLRVIAARLVVLAGMLRAGRSTEVAEVLGQLAEELRSPSAPGQESPDTTSDAGAHRSFEDPASASDAFFIGENVAARDVEPWGMYDDCEPLVRAGRAAAAAGRPCAVVVLPPPPLGRAG